MNTLKLNGFETITVPKYFIPGLGYSPASGPPSGGLWLGPSGDSSINNSGSFFGYDVKGLFPNSFGSKKRSSKKRSSKKVKKIKKSKKSKRMKKSLRK